MAWGKSPLPPLPLLMYLMNVGSCSFFAILISDLREFEWNGRVTCTKDYLHLWMWHQKCPLVWQRLSARSLHGVNTFTRNSMASIWITNQVWLSIDIVHGVTTHSIISLLSIKHFKIFFYSILIWNNLPMPGNSYLCHWTGSSLSPSHYLNHCGFIIWLDPFKRT